MLIHLRDNPRNYPLAWNVFHSLARFPNKNLMQMASTKDMHPSLLKGILRETQIPMESFPFCKWFLDYSGRFNPSKLQCLPRDCLLKLLRIVRLPLRSLRMSRTWAYRKAVGCWLYLRRTTDISMFHQTFPSAQPFRLSRSVAERLRANEYKDELLS